jgi:[CysO sulfur-carrier protein]-S-L-cysteine hydrolase
VASSGSGGPAVRVPREVAEGLVAHARAEFPNECCGMLSGHDGLAKGQYRARNIEASPFMYVMEPREQLRIMDEIDEAGLDLLAIYHSHTRSAAYPSRTDVELAFFPDALTLIVSLADPDAPEIRAYRIRREAPEDEQIAEVELQIV